MDVKARPHSGSLITFEGVSGAGKTTAMLKLEQWLIARGEEVVTIMEPEATFIGQRVHEVINDPQSVELCDDAELLLVFAARAQLIHERIRPALLRGAFVLCDRFVDATYAQQAAGRGRSLRHSHIGLLERRFIGITPDLTFLLDLPVDVAIGRARQGKDFTSDTESETREFLERVKSSYWRRLGQDPDRWRVIDASRPEETVIKAMTLWLEDFYETERALTP